MFAVPLQDIALILRIPLEIHLQSILEKNEVAHDRGSVHLQRPPQGFACHWLPVNVAILKVGRDFKYPLDARSRAGTMALS